MTLTQISSRGVEDTLRWSLGASGTDHYTFTGPGLTGTVNDPTIYLSRGQTYVFENNSGGHPFQIQSTAGSGGSAYNTGVTNNGGGNGTEIKITVPHDSPDILYYQCTSHANMGGQFNVAGSVADGSISTTKLANDAVNADKLASDAVVTASIIDDAVTADKLANSINTAIAANTAKDLTALSASNLTSGTVPDARFPATLPAVSGANLTGISSAGVNRNLIINGAMNVAQRGTLSTTSGYGTVDRFEARMGNVGVTPTQSQISLTSSDTGPWEKGFRNALRIALPSAGTANSNAEIQIRHKVENQDMANSGWNYPSSSDFLTLSFWFRCSTNQTFYLWLYNSDSGKVFALDFTASGNNTWTKITKQIKGASTLVFGDNNGEGLAISIFAYNGTAYTNNAALNTWQGYSGSNFFPDMATTWVTAGASTFDVTGVQLELGQTATNFAYESFADTLAKCKRYCHVISQDGYSLLGIGLQYYSGTIFIDGGPIDMRTTPTMVAKAGVSGAYNYEKLFGNTVGYIHQIALDAKTKEKHVVFSMSGDSSRGGEAVRCSVHAFSLSNNEPFVYLTAEL